MTPARLRSLATTALVLAALLLALLPGLHDAGGQRLDAMFTRALATFAVARALNGAISVAQGTEVALQPAGVGVTLTVGQVLDPLNDLVERFSWVMLAASAALGTQIVLLEASAAAPLSLLLVLVAFAVLLRGWLPALAALDRRALLPRVLILLLFVRLALPLAALGGHAFSEAWLEPRRVAAVATLERARDELDAAGAAVDAGSGSDGAIEEDARDEVAREDDGMFATLRRLLGSGAARLDPSASLAGLADRVDAAASRVVDLVVVFLLETIALPLTALWLLWRLTRLALPATGDPHD